MDNVDNNVHSLPLGLRLTTLIYGVIYMVCVHNIDPDKMKGASKAAIAVILTGIFKLLS